MPTQDPTQTVHQSQGNLWLFAAVPALLIIGYLLYSAYKQSSGPSSPESGPAESSSSDPTGSEGK